ncbi:O-acyltransferase like protein-like [Spodoptera litura]|uniref:O-acyltransferase like protein-like n=1 Tax=Spodoptera litura TaxID=69820 RepID=A0A9J7DNJ0_SPOLT|nr:O-acyltransferase like protein-like [Spodoptera litura]
MLPKIFVLFLCTPIVFSATGIERKPEAVDSNLLESVLDAEECKRQIRTIRRNAMFLLQFADAGIRTPRGVLTGNSVDMGNYHQCLGIDHQLEDMHIEGKYCSILVPVNQTLHLPRPQDTMSTHLNFDFNSLQVDNETLSLIEEYYKSRSKLQMLSGNFDGLNDNTRTTPPNPLIWMVFRLAVCIPKPCTTEQAISSLFFNVSAVGFKYTEDYCRLSNDKPWSSADYAAIIIFSILGFVTIISTSYDVCYRFVFKKDVKQISTIGRSFSFYTNGQRLTTFSSSGGNLQCIDGIRTLAMLWVIVGHTFSTEVFTANPADSQSWMFSAEALWITAATMTVDTFFTIGGVLLVYTTAAKMKQMTFLKNLHWFYLNRYVRVTPLLAALVLLQASYLNQFTDGPHWNTVIEQTRRCRNNWWSTILHIQNLVHLRNMCIPHSWYMAIDFQLYLVSPLVLFWVFSGKKLHSWIALIGSLIAVLIGSTIYSFSINRQAGNLVPSRFPEMMDYMFEYYFNTLTRASPFFVGMICGYILHLYRKSRIQIPWFVAIFFWACFAGILGGIFYFKYRIKQFEWDNQLIDNLMNSFMRPTYAVAICWLIIACVHGYSGPINWFLSLDEWRLPARLSYAMYLFHYPLMFSINGSAVAPFYFSVGNLVFKFMAYVALSVAVSFFFILLIDSPITVLFKLLTDSVTKGKPTKKLNEGKQLDKNNISDSPNVTKPSTEDKIDHNNLNEASDRSSNTNQIPEKSIATVEINKVGGDTNENIAVINENGASISPNNLAR